MSRSKQRGLNQDIINVLNLHDQKLKTIKFPSVEKTDKAIRRSEDNIRLAGGELTEPGKHSVGSSLPRVIVVPTWEELCREAEKTVGSDCTFDDLFTEEEKAYNEQAVKKLNDEYRQLYRLDKIDITISVAAGLLAAAVNVLLIGIPQKTKEGLRGGTLSNYIRKWFEERYPDEEMSRLANSKESKVPFDAQDNRNTTIYVEGLSAYYHRLLSLGHDPIIGFIVGIFDIMGGRMTTIDKKGHFVSQIMGNYSDRTEQDLFAALAKLILHLKTDINTAMGLPAPMMALFNYLQFGSIGEEELTIAEIVQGMYYQGYDFVHFCTQSIPVMIAEVVIRIGYSLKRIKEGNRIRDSIPFSSDNLKHPKLGTMLFLGHSAATAINAGYIYFKKDPMAINYPQWKAFAIYAYKQLKWGISIKPELCDSYVKGVIAEELDDVFESVNRHFAEYTENCVVVMN